MTRKNTSAGNSERKDASSALLDAGFSELQSQLDVVATRREALVPNGFDPALSAAAAALAKAMVSITAEQRNWQKLRASDLVKLTPEVVLEWLRRQPAEVRLYVMREIDDIDCGQSVFG